MKIWWKVWTQWDVYFTFIHGVCTRRETIRFRTTWKRWSLEPSLTWTTLWPQKLWQTRLLSTFGFIHEFGAIPTAKMTYTRLQYYTNKVVGEHGLQMFKIVVVVLSFDICVPISAHPLLFLDKWFLQIYLNVSYTSMIYIW